MTRLQAVVVVSVIVIAAVVGAYYYLVVVQPPFKGVTISFVAPPWVALREELVEEFQRETGMTVEVVSLEMNALIDRVEKTPAPGVEPVDVIFLEHQTLSEIVGPVWLEPLDDRITSEMRDDLTRLEVWEKGGKQYGVSVHQQTIMMEYNSQLLEAGGFTEPPKTWNEFTHMCETLMEKGVVESGFAASARARTWYTIALSMGDPLFDDDLNPTFNEPGARGLWAMRLLKEYFDRGIIHSDLVATKNPHPIFWANKSVFHQAWLGSLAVTNDPKWSTVAPYGEYMLLPERHWTWHLDIALGISKFSEHKDAAWRFMEFYLGERMQTAAFEDQLLAPASKKAFQRLWDQGEIEGGDIIEEQGAYVRLPPYHAAWWDEFDSYVTETITALARGEISPEDAVAALAAKVAELKGIYG